MITGGPRTNRPSRSGQGGGCHRVSRVESGGAQGPAGTGGDQELRWPRSAAVMPSPQVPGDPAGQECLPPSPAPCHLSPAPHPEPCPQHQPQRGEFPARVTGSRAPAPGRTRAPSQPRHCAWSVLCPWSCPLEVRTGEPREMKFRATAAVPVIGGAGRKWKPLAQSFLRAGAPLPRPRGPQPVWAGGAPLRPPGGGPDRPGLKYHLPPPPAVPLPFTRIAHPSGRADGGLWFRLRCSLRKETPPARWAVRVEAGQMGSHGSGAQRAVSTRESPCLPRVTSTRFTSA